MKMIWGIVDAVASKAGALVVSGAGRLKESFRDVVMLQHFGFVSKPPNGARKLIIRQGGSLVCIATDDSRYRIEIGDGEACIFNNEGVKVHLKAGKTVEISGAETVNMPDATAINLGGGSLKALVDERFKELFDAHAHLGVTAGSGTSGMPSTPLDIGSCSTSVVKAK